MAEKKTKGKNSQQEEKKPWQRTIDRLGRREIPSSELPCGRDFEYNPEIVKFDELFGDLLSAWVIYRRLQDSHFLKR